MKPIKKIQFLVCVLAFAANASWAQPYTVNVNTNAVPPVNPLISQYVASGNISAQVLSTVAGGPIIQVLAYGRIECLSPSPFTIAVNPSFAQQGAFSLTPGIPVSLSAAQQLAAFGNFNSANLVASGIALGSVTDAAGNIRLPAGSYRICYSVRQFDPASGQLGAFVSDPNLGCGNFTVTSNQPVNAVVITTNVIPPVNPFIGQSIGGGSVNANLQFNNPGGQATQVKLFGRIECLSPSSFTLTTLATFSSQSPLTITPGIPQVISAAQQLEAFGGMNPANLAASGISLSAITDAGNTIRLPAGTYRICYYARYIDAFGNLAGNASDPNTGCGSFSIAASQVNVLTTALPPINQVINLALANPNGGIKTILSYTNSFTPTVQARVYGRIERLSPSPFTIALVPGFQQQLPVTLTSGIPLQLSAAQLLDAFGNFNGGNVAIAGFNPGELQQNGNLRLPDGSYRICFFLKDLQGTNLSDPNLGCASFTVCGTVAAPQFTTPVSNLNINSGIVTVPPTSPLLFSWLPPNSLCGASIGALTYDFEIHLLHEGQLPTDAINNPPVITKTQLPSASYLLDTLLYKEVLQAGQRYVIRVKANAIANPSLVIDNGGYSRIEVFQYGNSQQPPVLPPQNPSDSSKGKDNNPPVINASSGDCGLTPPANTNDVASNETFQNKEIKVGEFKMVPTKITRNSDGSYSGKGTINWTPLASVSLSNVGSLGIAKLMVAFDKIKINTSLEVYDGTIVTETDPGVFSNASFNKLKDFAGKSGVQLDQLASKVEGAFNNNPNLRLISQLTGNTPVDLPLGLNNQDIGGTKATLAIMSIVFSPKGATASVLFDVNIEEANGWLTLAGTDFCIHPQGGSLTQGTLFLPNDRDFNIGKQPDVINIKFRGCPGADSTNGTYVTWKNGKIEDIVAHAELALPQNGFVPEDDNGAVTAGSVIAKIMFRFKEWHDWVASIDMPHFQLRDVKGLSFQPTVLFYDHSVKTNPPAFSYPSTWKGNKSNAFEGLYMQQFKILLPEDFKTFNQKKGERTSFLAKDLIVDETGITALIKGADIIDIKTGNLGGWGFSLKNLEVQITSSNFEKGKMDGQFLLPVSSTPLDYSGDLHLVKDSLSYDFLVQPSEKMNWDIWKASVALKKDSYIEVKRDSLGTSVVALMNGVVSIDLSDGAPAMKFDAIKFDSLGIANRNIVNHKKELWLSEGVWAFASPPKTVGGFPVTVGSITAYLNTQSDIEAGLKFKVTVGIGGENKTVIGAEAKLAVYGKMKISLDDFRPNFSLTAGVRADSLRLFGDVGPIKVDGWVGFYKKHNVYGNGLKGHVEATFPMVKLEATAQFGNVNDFNYWYIDASAQFATPIPVVGPIGINGFGGGAYYNMKMQSDPPKGDDLTAKTAANSTTVGSSMSGITYIPQDNSFGLKASVYVCMVTGAGPKAMNAKVTLGAGIVNGALDNLTLDGDVYVFTNPPSNDRAIVHGTVHMEYIVPEQKFSLGAMIDANFSAAKLKVPINLYAGPDGWYFKVGDPWGQRVTLDFPEAKTAVYHYKVGASAYFCAGSLINPQLPDLPAKVQQFLHTNGDPNIQSFMAALNSAPGSGLMFGAEVNGNLGFNLAFIYADATAILGFDLMLKNFEGLTCNGGKSAGWEGWYAMGQLYAYLGLDVGLNVDVWFYSGKISLAKFEAGALLRGGLPNPTWMEGSVKIEGEVLGGLVKVSTEAHFSIGDQCYPDVDPLKDVKIISDYGPKGNKESVFAYPYGASNVGLDKNYVVNLPPNQNHPDGESRIYQFRIKSFRLLKNGSTPVESLRNEYNEDRTTVSLLRNSILDAYTNYTGEIQSYAVQYVEGSGWIDPINDKTQKSEPVSYTDQFQFKTGPQPDEIWEGNIAFAYPVNRQRYVLKNELDGKGRIRLDLAQTNILNGNGKGLNALRKYQLYFIAVGTTDTIKTDFTWNEQTKEIEYQLPSALKNNTGYRLEFWSFEQSGMMKASSALVTAQTSMSSMNIKGVDAAQKQTKVVAAAVKVRKPIYTMFIRTSAFNTLAEKMSAMGNWTAGMKNNSLQIVNDAMSTEHFDECDTKGYAAPNGKNWYPPFLNTGIDWDNGQQNDQFASTNIYDNKLKLAFKNVTTIFGNDWLRAPVGRPLYTVDISRLMADKPLSPSETGEPQARTNGTVSSGGGMMMKLPLSNPNKNQSIAFNAGYQNIVWDREKYIYADYRLMKDFSNAVYWNAGYFNGWSASAAENFLSQQGGDLNLASNTMGGNISIPWNKFYYLYTDPIYSRLIRSLNDLPYQAFPKGTRTISFTYSPGNLTGAATKKSFTY